MAEQGPILRQAGPADSDQIRAVLAASFPGNPKADPAVMDWQYWSNPFGPACSWVAEAEGQVVAHYAGIRYPGWTNGAPISLALGVDAATLPAFRGLGLFEQLARAVYLGCGRDGIPFTYCLPNPNSLRGFIKAGGQELGRARVLAAPLNSDWLRQRLRVPRAAGRALVRGLRPGRGRVGSALEGPPPDLDGLWSRLGGGYGAGVARDSRWWQWRYGARPGAGSYLFFETRRAGRLTGAAVGLCRDDLGGRFLCLLELLAEDAEAAKGLLGTAGTAAGPLGAVGVATVALPGTPLYRRARQGGLWPLPRRLEPQPLHVGVVDNLATAGGPPRPWSLAWGDLDHL